MKFGDTLYRRSVPKWAAYNVNYNEIKRMIKEQTSVGVAVPVSIPTGSSNNRWATLDDDLFDVLKEQHDNISLFLKSKYGEIDRRLCYLEKQVRSAQKGIDPNNVNISPRTRRLHKLLEEAESIGEDIQNLTRFASVQKTAFRKIIKKYRKWTGSTNLQTRLDSELFSAGHLNLDYAHPLERLNSQTNIITSLIQGPQQRKQSIQGPLDRKSSLVPQPTSTVGLLRSSQEKGPIALDAAFATLPFGKSSGSAMYWIHPDNLDEAQALLLRYVREVHIPQTSRQSSPQSVDSERSRSQSAESVIDGTYMVFFDNPQRLLQDTSANRPSKIALSGRWCQDADAVVTLSNLAPWNPASTIVDIKRKDVLTVLDRESITPPGDRRRRSKSENMQRVEEYLSEHRDVKPLAQVHSTRSRFVGTRNSSQAGIWAVLDTDIVISPFYSKDTGTDQVNSGEAFPHATLEIRWEFSHTPEIVRAFNTSHLAERVQGFTLELAALHTTNKQLPSPSWKPSLEKDIRKIPLTKTNSTRRGRSAVVGASSGASSTEGAGDSIFSDPAAPSSATSVESPNDSIRELGFTEISKKPLSAAPKRNKKKARIDAESPPPRANRYWNEFDDGDEDVNPHEAYTIYVDPEQSFPGAETVSKMFGSMYKRLGSASSRVSLMFSLKSQPSLKRKSRKKKVSERSPLLGESRSNSDEAESSDSDTTPTSANAPRLNGSLKSTFPSRLSLAPSRLVQNSYYRPHQLLTPRQVALERTYFMSYTGLTAISYMLLFVSGMLIATGRKRDHIEVDVGVIAGLASAELCAVLTIVLMWMRRTPMGILHWGIFTIALVGIFVLGIGELVAMINRPTATTKS